MRSRLVAALVAAAPALLALWPASAPNPSAAAGPGGVIQMVKKHYAALDAGDPQAALAMLAAAGETQFPITWYDVGSDGQPITVQGREAVGSALATQCAQNKVLGWKTRFADDIHADCHSPELGYATMTLERKAEGQPVQRLRLTALACYVNEKNAWRWFHLHVSPVTLPAAAKPAAAGGTVAR